MLDGIGEVCPSSWEPFSGTGGSGGMAGYGGGVGVSPMFVSNMAGYGYGGQHDSFNKTPSSTKL